jgi:AraC family transcriptional regulator
MVVDSPNYEKFRGGMLWTRILGPFTIHEGVYEPNRVLTRHRHEQAYVSLALGGAYVEQCESREWDCETGGTIFHFAGETHANRFHQTGARLLILEVANDYLARLAEHGISTDRQHAFTSPYCLQLGLKLHRFLGASDPLSEMSAQGIALELLAEALGHPAAADKQRSTPDWLGIVNQMVRDRYRERLTLNELAQQVSVHPVHLARAFRKHYQSRIGDLIRSLRIEAACHELKHSDLTIAEIAMRTGFTDQSHLCRMLKRHTGMSPALFRKSSPE